MIDLSRDLSAFPFKWLGSIYLELFGDKTRINSAMLLAALLKRETKKVQAKCRHLAIQTLGVDAGGHRSVPLVFSFCAPSFAFIRKLSGMSLWPGAFSFSASVRGTFSAKSSTLSALSSATSLEPPSSAALSFTASPAFSFSLTSNACWNPLAFPSLPFLLPQHHLGSLSDQLLLVSHLLSSSDFP